jgi:hypothetical protein
MGECDLDCLMLCFGKANHDISKTLQHDGKFLDDNVRQSARLTVRLR